MDIDQAKFHEIVTGIITGNKGWPTTTPIVNVRALTRADEFVPACRWWCRAGEYGPIVRNVQHVDVIQLDVQPIFPGHGQSRVWYAPAYQGPHPRSINRNVVALTEPDTFGFNLIEFGCHHEHELTRPYSNVHRYRCTLCEWEYDVDHGD